MAPQICSTGRLQGSVQRVLVEDVNEGVTDGRRAIGQFEFTQGPHKSVDPVEFRQSLLNVGWVAQERTRQHRRVELMALYAGGGQKEAIRHFQLLDLAADQTPDGSRQLRTNSGIGRASFHRPSSSAMTPESHESSQQVAEEERIALRAPVQVGCQLVGKVMTGEFQGQILHHVRRVEET